MAQSWAWQEQLSRFAKGPLAERLNELFDQYSNSSNEVVRIDRLEVTSEIFSKENWEALLLDDIARKVADALHEPAPSKDPDHFPKAGVEHLTSQEQVLEMFFHFLETGRLPWSVGKDLRENFETRLRTVLREKIAAKWVGKFHLLLRGRQVQKRLANQFNEPTLFRVLDAFYRKTESEITESQAIAKKIMRLATVPKSEWKMTFREIFFENPSISTADMARLTVARQLSRKSASLTKLATAFPKKPEVLPDGFGGLRSVLEFAMRAPKGFENLSIWAQREPVAFEQFLMEIFRKEKLAVEVFRRMEQAQIPLEKLLPFFAQSSSRLEDLPDDFFEKKHLDKHPAWTTGGSKSDTPEKPEEKDEKEIKEGFILKKPDGPAKEDTQQSADMQSEQPELETTLDDLQILAELTGQDDQLAEGEPVFVRNAGMVILHPFLPALFEELGFAEKGEIRKPERATHLLQFLATGQIGAPEFELPLNKLLCGMPLAKPVSKRVRLTKKEKSEAEKMLKAVISHWRMLGKTSVGGLQGTYLCREGKLSLRADGDWQLQVEQRGFDILLSDLPWSISMIKLPWMPKMLWVEWG